MLPSNSEAPSFCDLRALALKRFGKRPCLWQLKVAKAFLQKDRDIVCIAGTSLGKTMSFWLPLLWKKGLQIIVTPLNQLGKQNVDSLAKAGMQSISISGETASWSNFRDIEDLKYLVIIVSPEQLMKPGGEFEKLLRKPEFAKQIIGFVFDEAHCVTSWVNGDIAGFSHPKVDAHFLRAHLPGLSEKLLCAAGQMKYMRCRGEVMFLSTRDPQTLSELAHKPELVPTLLDILRS
ncbi:hypothetical protein EV702DRAFT_1219569 [Suillus placidus]|uniref:DNA 3'-5' helicase n=1 Tax=Suillus placidus TaxID=48579 RepID=A0A9P6ZFE9_9AGAM|nr:hypothetical protein EV702DRAFT_1219569 [Suillus placidus]